MSKLKKTGKHEDTESVKIKKEVMVPPLDDMVIKVFGLWLSEEAPPNYVVKILVSAIIKPFCMRDSKPGESEHVCMKGSMNYDPSDYERMSLFADTPLIVTIQPLKSLESSSPIPNSPVESSPSAKPGSVKDDSKKGGKQAATCPQVPTQSWPMRSHESTRDISCCNVDILPIFLDQDNICVKKRMQPMRAQRYLKRKSWDNLPLLKMSVAVLRHADNARHHRLLQNANWMKVTVIGAYNLYTPYSMDCYYTAATKMPVSSEMGTDLVMFVEGTTVPLKFNCTRFYPRWESLRLQGEIFTKGDDKFTVDIQDIFNPDEINLDYYLNKAPIINNTIWGSFHRSLMLGSAEDAIWQHCRDWRWPLEVHYYGDAVGGYSFMGFMDLFPLLYPGVRKLALAVPLYWFNRQAMLDKCNCGVLLLPNDKLAGISTPMSKPKSETVTSLEDDLRATGADDKVAFVLVEVEFHHPLVPESIPPYIRQEELIEMLRGLEPQKGKRACRGRGQLNDNWQSTVRAAANSLRRVPHHGLTDLCIFARQLSESRTRVEILTTFWIEAALYVNNNFVVPPYLDSKEMYEELLKMSHVCMMKQAVDTLVPKDESHKEPLVRAARHARQVNDVGHAMDLYMQAAVQSPFDGNTWRELSTLLKDVDSTWADVCMDKALSLNVRHPLTILSKGCMVFEEDAAAAEVFFTSLLNLYPLWPTAYIICQAYCTNRELFRLADEIKKSLQNLREERLVHEQPLPRAWEHELGDFWEPTVLLPGMSPYYDAADLLIRIRALRLAEVCLGISLAESGETAAYYHLTALCSRLAGDFESALCLVQKAIEMFGQSGPLRCLEAECYHEMGDTTNAMVSFEKAKGGTNPYSTMLSLPCWEPQRVRLVLVDMLRRQPSAYGWMALANDWVMRADTQELDGGEPQRSDAPPPASCAVACAVQALKLDRRAGRAWALLAKMVRSQTRRQFCYNMASASGFMVTEDTDFRELQRHSQESICHLLGTCIKECRCHMCEAVHF